MGGHPIPVNDLNEVAGGEGLTFQCVQREKTTDCAFYVAHSYRFRRHRATGQHEGERPEPRTWYQETLYQDIPFCAMALALMSYASAQGIQIPHVSHLAQTRESAPVILSSAEGPAEEDL